MTVVTAGDAISLLTTIGPLLLLSREKGVTRRHHVTKIGNLSPLVTVGDGSSCDICVILVTVVTAGDAFWAPFLNGTFNPVATILFGRFV